MMCALPSLLYLPTNPFLPPQRFLPDKKIEPLSLYLLLSVQTPPRFCKLDDIHFSKLFVHLSPLSPQISVD